MDDFEKEPLSCFRTRSTWVPFYHIAARQGNCGDTGVTKETDEGAAFLHRLFD
jgi:hypothetical protein